MPEPLCLKGLTVAICFNLISMTNLGEEPSAWKKSSRKTKLSNPSAELDLMVVFGEVIPRISRPQFELEEALWAIVRDRPRRYAQDYPSPASLRRIVSLLAGEPLRCKGHLINRVFKRSDREVEYLSSLSNPMPAIRGES